MVFLAVSMPVEHSVNTLVTFVCETFSEKILICYSYNMLKFLYAIAITC